MTEVNDLSDVEANEAASVDGLAMWVIRPNQVRRSVDELLSSPRAGAFPAYLLVRRQAGLQGTLDSIDVAWSELIDLLHVPGGPGRLLRPFHSKARNGSQEWFDGNNLAGSYSYGSFARQIAAHGVFSPNEDGTYELPGEHWNRALEKLLGGTRLPSLAVAAYLLRNFGFMSRHRPTTADLVEHFRAYFGYGAADEAEYTSLFDDSWAAGDEDWMEPV